MNRATWKRGSSAEVVNFHYSRKWKRSPSKLLLLSRAAKRAESGGSSSCTSKLLRFHGSGSQPPSLKRVLLLLPSATWALGSRRGGDADAPPHTTTLTHAHGKTETNHMNTTTQITESQTTAEAVALIKDLEASEVEGAIAAERGGQNRASVIRAISAWRMHLRGW